MPVKFIVFEGLDGSGKTTQLRLYAQHLRDILGPDKVFATEEPWSGVHFAPLSQTGPAGLRAHILARAKDGASPAEMSLLFAADRRAHIALAIQPALDAGCVVLCDRYVQSSYAYQASYAVGPEDGPLARLITNANAGIAIPDVAIVIDIPQSIAQARAKGGAAGDVFDAAELDVYAQRAEMYAFAERFGFAARIARVDGRQSRMIVAEDVRRILDPLVLEGGM